MDLIPDFDLSRRNTLQLRAQARFAAEVENREALVALADESRALDLPLHVIGGGSNLVLPARLEAIVALMAIRGRTIDDQRNGQTLVSAGAGENWHAFVAWTVDQGLAGLENLAGIPGTVGAAPVQNIGAYGVQLSDFFVSLEAYDLEEKRTVRFDRAACGFAYRQSIFKAHPGRYAILSVTLALPDKWHPNRNYPGLDRLADDADARTIMNTVLALRGSKLPDWQKLGNAGSFFHNPVVTAEFAAAIDGAPRYPQADGSIKLSAGWLIEQCGLKGERLGPVGMYEGHALVLVNHGGASSDDVAKLAELVKERVRQRFGVELQQEPIAL